MNKIYSFLLVSFCSALCFPISHLVLLCFCFIWHCFVLIFPVLPHFLYNVYRNSFVAIILACFNLPCTLSALHWSGHGCEVIVFHNLDPLYIYPCLASINFTDPSLNLKFVNRKSFVRSTVVPALAATCIRHSHLN